MSIHVWKGVLKIPIKLFYILALGFGVMAMLCLRLLRHEEAREKTICAEENSYYPPLVAQNLTGAKHAGCSKDPPYFNTWMACPECFRPTVEDMSVELTKIPDQQLLFPRGPPNFFKPRGTKQQDVIQEVLITPSSVCIDTCPYLLALQLSVSDRFDERNTIRTTWGSVAKTKIWPHALLNADFQIVFVLAHRSKFSELGVDKGGAPKILTTHKEMARIRAEANRHGDILYLDMLDSYFNLTLKLMSTLHWVRYHCPRTKFFLKVDADTFVHVPLIIDLLIYNEEKLYNSIMGHIYLGEKNVFRTGRWGVSKDLYPLNMFPVYASGCSYVISNKAVNSVVEHFPYFPIMDLEDVFITGILGKAAKVNYFSQNLFYVFTAFHNDDWNWCSFLNDSLATGTGVNRKFKKNVIWSGFLLNEWECRTKNLLQMPCHCDEEFGNH